jgi:Kef-type K+ transport system membrane component KefB
MASALLAANDIEHIAAFVFLDIAIIVVVARLMGALFVRIRQPAVVGEIVAGIALGPTLLGAFGDLDQKLFPLEARPYLKVVAELGLIIFMFIVGLELDLALIRGKERVAAVISASSVALPFALGTVLAFALYTQHGTVEGEEVRFVPFALFIGASMAVTAFPVLARILTERGMYRTEVGALTLACAAVDDILAWSLLALVIAVVEATSLAKLPIILGWSVLFIGFMFLVVKPQLAKLVPRFRDAGRLTPGILSVALVGILVSSFITAEIGIHAIFGAFLFGVIMPRDAELTHAILERLESVSVVLLLPVFFIVTGLNVNIRGIGLAGLAQLALILLVACTGKFAGAAVAARAQGIPGRKASAIGILMNTRGLTELVILNIGLAAGVLTSELFTLLVVMAVLTTMMTEPLLRVAYPDKLLRRDVEEAERAALGALDAFRVLLVVDDPDAGLPAADVAAAAARSDPEGEVVATRFLRLDQRLEVGSGLGGDLVAMTASFEGLARLTERVEHAGARAVARSQFSGDVVADTLAQVSVVEADAVVVAGRSSGDDDDGTTATERLRRLLVDADVDVLVLLMGGVGRESGTPPPPRAPTRVVGLTEGSDGDVAAAAAWAVRLGVGWSVPVTLLVPAGDRRGVRRLTSAVAALADVGVQVAVEPAGDDLAGELRTRAAGGVAVVAADPAWGERAGVGPLADEVSRGGPAVVAVRGRAELGAPSTAERLQTLAGDLRPATETPTGSSGSADSTEAATPTASAPPAGLPASRDEASRQPEPGGRP